MSDKACLYPGSFDPVTLGHMDVIRRLCGMYEKVYVGILVNPDKKNVFSAEERKSMLEKACEDMTNAEVIVWDGLTVDLLRKLKIRILARGIRTWADFENETVMSRLNKTLYPEAETVFLAASPEKQDISSSSVRQLMCFGGDISAFVPTSVTELIRKRTQNTDK